MGVASMPLWQQDLDLSLTEKVQRSVQCKITSCNNSASRERVCVYACACSVAVYCVYVLAMIPTQHQ